MKSGIYQITNTVNGKFYIGSSANIKGRLSNHKSRLIRDKHANIHLQRSFNKVGIENLKFEILAKTPAEYLIKLEQFFIDKLKPEFNIRKEAQSNKGIKSSEETKLKQSLALKGKRRSQEAVDRACANRYRPIYKICSSSLEILDTFKSSVDAAKDINSGKGTIINAVVGRIASLKGYIWEYVDSYDVDRVIAKRNKMPNYKKYKTCQ